MNLKHAKFRQLSAQDAAKITRKEWIISSYIEQFVRVTRIRLLEVSIKQILLFPLQLLLTPIGPLLLADRNFRWAKSHQHGIQCEELGVGLSESFIVDVDLYGRDVDDFSTAPCHFSMGTKTHIPTQGKE
jgi:hypothetical protein